MWGIVFILVEPWLARSPGGYWVGSITFGAIFPALVAWFVVLPLKGLPAGNGFHFPVFWSVQSSTACGDWVRRSF